MTEEEFWFKKIDHDLRAESSLKVRDWWNRYLKYEIEFLGVSMGNIRKILSRTFVPHATLSQQYEQVLFLMQRPQAEFKLAAILILSEQLFESIGLEDLNEFSRYFKENLIWDWNTTDWFCMKVLGKKLEADFLKQKTPNRDFVRQLSSWKNSENFWQKRASLVGFVKVAHYGNRFYKGFVEAKISDATEIVQYAFTKQGNENRFLNTGVGWLLRELSVSEPRLVENFLEKNANFMTKEGVRYCKEKLVKK